MRMRYGLAGLSERCARLWAEDDAVRFVCAARSKASRESAIRIVREIRERRDERAARMWIPGYTYGGPECHMCGTTLWLMNGKDHKGMTFCGDACIQKYEAFRTLTTSRLIGSDSNETLRKQSS